MANRIIQLAYETAADWTSNNPTLENGRIGIESDTNRFKIGDGATAWTSLAYFTVNIIPTKLDIGIPGAGGGLDVGEGGSYTTNPAGTTIVKAFKYDASAVSGSRFTEFTLDDTNTWLGDAGDRLYIGSPNKIWAARFNLTQAKSAEVFEGFYWNGALVGCDIMGILKDSATTTGQAVLEQTSEKEYITWDHHIDADWATADNQLDTIPNTGTALYWIALQVPGGGLTTPPITDEIKARGTDFDIVSGASYPVIWGMARLERHFNVSLAVIKVPGGVTTAEIDITSAHTATVFVFDGVGDNATFSWILPEGIDSSSPIEVKLTYMATAADTYNIDLTALKIKNATEIGAGITADYTSSTAIVAAASDLVYTEVTLMATHMSIQDLGPTDAISFEIERTDTTNTIYPMSITIHYAVFAFGEHV